MSAGRVLVVDDDSFLTDRLCTYLQSQSYEVEVAPSGEDALEICRRQLPDVILLDTMLSDIDGYEVYKRLRGNVRTSHIPIIIITQIDERSERIHGLELGVDDYITKPLDLEQLGWRVRNKIARSRPVERTLTGAKIMIVGDDSETVVALKEYFQSQGCEATVHSSERALYWYPFEMPDAIILDDTLADTGVYERVQTLQSDPRASHIPVIFLVERGESVDRVNGLELGTNDYAIKPLQLEELGSKVLDGILASSLCLTVEPSHSKGRMLIVEDDFDISNMLRIYFRSQGYEVVTAGRGEEALAMCWRHPPDVVVLDIRLPDILGFDVCRELRGRPRTRYISIIFLSQMDERSDQLIGLELGADDYITKPFDIEELRVRVQSALKRAKYQHSVNAVTRLPGSQIVEEQLTELLFDDGWAALHISINNLYPFRETYGAIAGEQILRFTVWIMDRSMSELGMLSNFIGHINNDEFIVITNKEQVKPLAKHIKQHFDAEVGTHYDWRTRQQGYMIVRDEEGNGTKADLMALSIGVVTVDDGPFANAREIIRAASEAK